MTLRRLLGIATLISVATLPSAHAQTTEEVRNGRVASQAWGISLAAPSYEIWEDHPLRGRPNFLAAGLWKETGCSVHLSLFAILVESETSAATCRTSFAGNPVPLQKAEGVTVLDVEDAPVAWTRFDAEMESGIVQNQLYGYWTRDESCFELHLSSISCTAFSEIAMPILESVELQQRPGVNVETVSVGRALSLEPDHWKVHQVIAGEYLHNLSPTNPGRARTYYENALRLARGSIGFEDEWTIQAGLGLAWLHEDNGESAISPLRKAVELARSEPAAVMELDESLYNLACAYSLVGNVGAACDATTELMAALSERERRMKFQSMQRDPQLQAMLSSGCLASL